MMDYSFYIEEISPDEKWYVSFEDNGEVAYMYLGIVDEKGDKGKILDDLWIYNMIYPPIEECKEVFLYWDANSTKVVLIVDKEGWGIYDIKNWRKINSVREGNRIISIPHEIWERGISEQEGKPIKPPPQMAP